MSHLGRTIRAHTFNVAFKSFCDIDFSEVEIRAMNEAMLHFGFDVGSRVLVRGEVGTLVCRENGLPEVMFGGGQREFVFPWDMKPLPPLHQLAEIAEEEP